MYTNYLMTIYKRKRLRRRQPRIVCMRQPKPKLKYYYTINDNGDYFDHCIPYSYIDFDCKDIKYQNNYDLFNSYYEFNVENK